MYLCLAAYTITILSGGESWWTLISLVPLVLTFVIYFRTLRVAKEINEKGVSRTLDRNQRMMREGIYQRAYNILGAFFLMIFAYITFAMLFESRFLPLPEASTLGAGIILPLTLVVASLPASITVWMEPDSLHEED